MKKVLLLVTILFAFCSISKAQEKETTTPLNDVEIFRNVLAMDIEGETHYDCVVSLKSISPDSFRSNYAVKINIKNRVSGKKIYKKTFSGAYLYVFANGQIQVGRPNFNQVIIYKKDSPESSNRYEGIIREKEGVY